MKNSAAAAAKRMQEHPDRVSKAWLSSVLQVRWLSVMHYFKSDINIWILTFLPHHLRPAGEGDSLHRGTHSNTDVQHQLSSDWKPCSLHLVQEQRVSLWGLVSLVPTAGQQWGSSHILLCYQRLRGSQSPWSLSGWVSVAKYVNWKYSCTKTLIYNTQHEVSQLWQSVRHPDQPVIQTPGATVDQLQLY